MKNTDWFFWAFFLSLSSAPAYAYIDPSAGNLWIQSLIAVFATLGTVIRMYWQKIKLTLFKNKNASVQDNTKKSNDTH